MTEEAVEPETIVVPPSEEETDAKLVEEHESWQSRVRDSVTPFLPPPVVAGMQRLDPALEPYLGPDAVVTATFTTMVAALTLWILSRCCLSITRGSGKAVRSSEDDEQRQVVHGDAGVDDFEETVLLCGPRHSGKTRLFYQLCYSKNMQPVPTLMSIKANIGIQHPIRYFDWPGHSKLSPDLDPILQQKDSSSGTVRVVVVLDATQPVRAAAETLNELFEILVSSASSNKKRTTTPLRVFVACHKSDLPKAKNARRIKIQLRTELEKILEASSSSAAEGEKKKKSWWQSSSELDLDAISFCRLHFGSTQCQNGTISPELLTFCHTGKLPEE